MTNRRFYVASETRYYSPDNYRKVFTHDFTGISTLQTDDNNDGTFENTWTTSDYHQMPLNATLDGEPYTWLMITDYGSYTFPKTVVKGLLMTATFGYSATAPPEIREATMIAAGQIWKRKDAIFGVAGTNGLGLIQVIQGQLERDAHFMDLIYSKIKGPGSE